MHPFSGPALFSLKKIAGSFTFIALFHVCGLCVRISVELIVKCLFCVVASSADPEGGGGTGGPDPPGKSQVIWFQQGISNWTPPPPPPPPWKMLDSLWNIKNDSFLWN